MHRKCQDILRPARISTQRVQWEGRLRLHWVTNSLLGAWDARGEAIRTETGERVKQWQWGRRGWKTFGCNSALSGLLTCTESLRLLYYFLLECWSEQRTINLYPRRQTCLIKGVYIHYCQSTNVYGIVWAHQKIDSNFKCIHKGG